MRLLILFLLLIAGSACAAPNLEQKVSLDLESVALATVLNTIASQYNLNMVISDDIDGDVSVRLTDVSLKLALDAILLPNKYNYFVKDEVVIIKALDVSTIDEFTSEVITLKYATPGDVVAALTSIKTESGTVSVLGNNTTEGSATNEDYTPNRIFVSDRIEVVKRMKTVVDAIDIEERMLSITVKIIESKLDNESKLGLSWPTAVTAKIGKTDNGTSTDVSTAEDALSKNLNQGGWTWGTLSVAQLSTVLNLLESNGNSKLISDPHITTLENHTAEIKVNTVIPIQTINRFTEAAATQDIVTFYDEEVGLTLKVTPRINENGKITMMVEPTVEDIIGYSGTVENQKPITASRSIKTTITVNDGETAALGGLLKDDIRTSEQKVPVLGSIPLLGNLFKSKSEEKSKTDLIILITPTIIK